MTELTDDQLLSQLRALRAPPPENGFEQRLSERLREASEARPAPVISLAGWRKKRVILALAAAALPMVAYAAASGWIGGWSSEPSEPTEAAPARAPAAEPAPGGPGRSFKATPPPADERPPQAEKEGPSPAPAVRARVVERVVPRGSSPAAAPLAAGESKPARALTEPKASGSEAELGATERVRIRVGHESATGPASREEAVPRIRSRGEDGVGLEIRERERESLERRERKSRSGWEEERGRRSGPTNEERRAKNRLRAR